ncbi:hypothetical protein BDW62DRAFT_212741 [Aspergillus aurantiobrunneus]
MKRSRTCPYCNREFHRLEHLQRHEKPYSCDCGESFGRRDLLKRHQRLVHEGLEPSPCAHRNRIPNQTSVPSPTQLHENVAVHSPAPTPRREGQVVLTVIGIIYPETSELYPPLEEFSEFINSMGLALDLDSPLNLGGLLPEHGRLSDTPKGNNASTLSSRTARHDPDEDQVEYHHRTQMPTLLPIPLTPWIQAAVYIPLLKISETQRENMLQALTPFQHLLSRFTLPSRESLTRFSNAYFDGVYLHMPFIHCASFNPERNPLELVLAMAAAGAQYRYEHRKGRSLYYASKVIFQEKQKAKERRPLYSHAPAGASNPTGPYSFTPSIADDLRCLLNLMVYATWQQDVELVRDACDLQSLLVRLLRDSGLVEENTTSSAISSLDWQTWLQLESDRRVKLFSFAFLNLQSIAYSLPPILLSSEINLRLPCTCDEWRTVDELHWKQARQTIHHDQSLFQDALSFLLEDKSDTHGTAFQPIPSPTASLLLIHGLLQRILLSRQASMSRTVPQVDIFTNALRRWTLRWQLAPESSLDPLNPNGPIPFTSTALLGLAYTRLELDLGPSRMLKSRNPHEIARALWRSPSVDRGPQLLPALLHATHALSIPVNLGVEYVSRSQAFVWSIQHALCGLEFAALLGKWLKAVGRSMEEQPLEEHEQRILVWIRRIVEEGRSSVEDEDTTPEDLDCDQLALSVVRLWARIMRGNAQWPFVDVIGQSLEIYAAAPSVVEAS